MKDSEPRNKGKVMTTEMAMVAAIRVEVAVEAGSVVLMTMEEILAGKTAPPRPKQQRRRPAKNTHHLQRMRHVLSPSSWEQKVLMENWTSSNL